MASMAMKPVFKASRHMFTIYLPYSWPRHMWYIQRSIQDTDQGRPLNLLEMTLAIGKSVVVHCHWFSLTPIRLEPHEHRDIEVILLGHSMGGLLSAEVALQRPVDGLGFRHRILGTINFDTPFLGMHPGVVVSGLGSLFRPAPEAPKPVQSPANSDYMGSPGTSTHTPSISDASSQWTGFSTPLSSPPTNDPNYNPPFPNDIRLTERKGWSSALHFINKHANDFSAATKQYVTSHIEFGGTMADYPALKKRYARIRELEDVDDITRHPGPYYHPPARRIRFVNYYTASTGRPKPPKPSKSSENLPKELTDENGIALPVEVELKDMTLDEPRSSHDRSPTPTPEISVAVHDQGNLIPQKLKDAPEAPPLSPVKAEMQHLGKNSGVQNDVQESDLAPMQHVDSIPIDDDDDLYSATDLKPIPTTEVAHVKQDDKDEHESQPVLQDPGLPPIPPMPQEPPPFNPDAYADKDARKLAEKEHKRVMKVYTTAIKDRESAIKDRKKYVEKQEKKAKQEEEKRLKAEEKQRLKEEKEEEKRKATINTEPRQEERRASTATGVEESKPKRDKKFCMLPPEVGGKRDKTWIRVFMEGVDEVGAHCGLFFAGPQYESLVNDVGERIASWVEDDATRRAIEEAERG